jgi:hypothetical protein
MSADADPLLHLAFEAEIIVWRGPSPYFFAPVPQAEADEIRRVAKAASYGWGVIPVEATVREVVFTTSLFPRDGAYLLPLKDAVRHKAGVTAGDQIAIDMTVRFGRR